jgi:nuclear pore complex protein Nup54
MFSSTFGAPTTGQQTGGSIFGTSATGQNQQTGGGLFSSLGQNNQQNQLQSTGMFGGLGLGQNTQNQQQTGSLGFGQNTQQQTQPQQSTGLFGGLGQSNQPQQQQAGSVFNTQQQGLGQPQQSQFNNSIWQPNSGLNPRKFFDFLVSFILTFKGEKSIPDQIKTVLDQWDTGSPNCAFQYYFYNKVPPHTQEYFRPGPNEDPKKWEDALKLKPGPGYVPVLCTGFSQLAERLLVQASNLAVFNSELHKINTHLEDLLHKHEMSTSIRAMDAKRKHMVLKRRCLVLATKVQILRNRGYAMGGDEEDLKAKLVALEKGVSDPGLDARQEEIWARMVTVQERARLLKAEIEKNGQPAGHILDEQTNKWAQKVRRFSSFLGHANL